MILKLTREKGVTFTSLTSSSKAYEIYKKLGFSDFETGSRIIYRFPSVSGYRYAVYTDDGALCRYLSSSDLKIFNNHRAFDCTHVVIVHEKEYCYLIVTVKKSRAKIHYVSFPEFFASHIIYLRNKILSLLGVSSLQVDERYLQGRSVFFSRKKVLSRPRQYKSEFLKSEDINALYSEFIVLSL